MSENKSIMGFEIDVMGRNRFEYPGHEINLLDTNEEHTGERFGIDFLSPCLGIIGYDSGEDVFHGAHIVAPTGSKVEDFVEKYEPDAVVVTGLNYSEEQLDEHEYFGGHVLGSENIDKVEPSEAYDVAADGGVSMSELSPVEDMLCKRGDIEDTLDQYGIEYETAWCPGPTTYSVVDATIPEEEIRIGHL